MPQPSPIAVSIPTSTDQQGTVRLALTMGDVCGIGPEVIAKWWPTSSKAAAIMVGCPEVMRRAVQVVAKEAFVHVVTLVSPEHAWSLDAGQMGVWVPPGMPTDLLQVPWGRVDVRAGRAAVACVREAMRLAREGAVGGMVTAPLHKEALALAGEPYPGHTELLQAEGAGLTGMAPNPVRMMLVNDELKTVLVTVHVSLRQAIEQVTHMAVLETVRMAHRSAQGWGLPQARIAVAGLNPHAGEGGLFGNEEATVIAPAIADARHEGINAIGPIAPDTVFMRARHTPSHPGEFDVVVAMYHDQGLIPIKYLGLDQGVNVTLGLPFVRTSPDHGTAFDLAGTGRADPSSFGQAVAVARQLLAGQAACDV